MPERTAFIDDQEYLSNLITNSAHSTGHKDRLNRKWLNNYSTYRGLEECCAELQAYW